MFCIEAFLFVPLFPPLPSFLNQLAVFDSTLLRVFERLFGLGLLERPKTLLVIDIFVPLLPPLPSFLNQLAVFDSTLLRVFERLFDLGLLERPEALLVIDMWLSPFLVAV
jgi:hypothetical protein